MLCHTMLCYVYLRTRNMCMFRAGDAVAAVAQNLDSDSLCMVCSAQHGTKIKQLCKMLMRFFKRVACGRQSLKGN